MGSLISYLSKRKIFTVILAGIYLSFVVFYHRKVSNIFDWLRDVFSFKVYNDVIFDINLMIMLIFSCFVFIKVIKGERKVKMTVFWGYNLLLILLSYKVLITVNIETIHYIQYAILTLPVFALVLRYWETVLWVTLLGALDEAYQYFVLYRDNNEVYLDFNDIILNLIGAGLGVVLIYTLMHEKFKTSSDMKAGTRSWYRSPVLAITMVLLLTGLFLYSAGFLRSYPGEDAKGALIVLSRKPASKEFWTIPQKSKPYHAVSPLEGMITLAFLAASYSLMDKRSSKGNNH